MTSMGVKGLIGVSGSHIINVRKNKLADTCLPDVITFIGINEEIEV